MINTYLRVSGRALYLTNRVRPDSNALHLFLHSTHHHCVFIMPISHSLIYHTHKTFPKKVLSVTEFPKFEAWKTARIEALSKDEVARTEALQKQIHIEAAKDDTENLNFLLRKLTGEKRFVNQLIILSKGDVHKPCSGCITNDKSSYCVRFLQVHSPSNKCIACIHAGRSCIVEDSKPKPVASKRTISDPPVIIKDKDKDSEDKDEILSKPKRIHEDNTEGPPKKKAQVEVEAKKEPTSEDAKPKPKIPFKLSALVDRMERLEKRMSEAVKAKTKQYQKDKIERLEEENEELLERVEVLEEASEAVEDLKKENQGLLEKMEELEEKLKKMMEMWEEMMG